MKYHDIIIQTLSYHHISEIKIRKKKLILESLKFFIVNILLVIRTNINFLSVLILTFRCFPTIPILSKILQWAFVIIAWIFFKSKFILIVSHLKNKQNSSKQYETAVILKCQMVSDNKFKKLQKSISSCPSRWRRSWYELYLIKCFIHLIFFFSLISNTIKSYEDGWKKSSSNIVFLLIRSDTIIFFSWKFLQVFINIKNIHFWSLSRLTHKKYKDFLYGLEKLPVFLNLCYT